MKTSLNIKILWGVVIGVCVGLLIMFVIGAKTSLGMGIIKVSDIVGKTIFIGLLKMILVPLVFLSICTGIANLKQHAQMGKVWKISLLYFLTTTGLSVLLGLIVVNVFKPGVGVSQTLFTQEMSAYQATQNLTLGSFVENFISQLFINPVKAMANGSILATVVFAIMLGIAIIVSGEKSKKLHSLLEEGFHVIMLMIDWIMNIAPYGIACLLVSMVATQNIDLLVKLLYFIIIVIGAFLCHGLIVLPLILKTITKQSPLLFFSKMRKALITAFSTSSSSATLPVTIDCVENNFDVNKNIAGFVLPLGATINMDGTALYEAVAAIFIANLMGIDLNLAQQVTIFFMAMIAAIGAPGIPSAGMVTMAMVLQSVGLPVEAIGILLPIDRLLDAIRTTINVEGDAIGSLVVHKITSDQT